MKSKPAAVEEQPGVSAEEEKTGSDKRIILLVDDAPADIQAAHNILKDTYIIKIATSGARALDLAKVAPQPDLILLDVRMPEMDGYEVCSRLKADPDTRDIPTRIRALPGPVELPGNESAIPRKDRIRFGDAGDLFESFTAQSLANFSKRGPLWVRQAQPGRQMRSQDAILRSQILICSSNRWFTIPVT